VFVCMRVCVRACKAVLMVLHSVTRWSVVKRAADVAANIAGSCKTLDRFPGVVFIFVDKNFELLADRSILIIFRMVVRNSRAYKLTLSRIYFCMAFASTITFRTGNGDGRTSCS
jgi:hypothetical protein